MHISPHHYSPRLFSEGPIQPSFSPLLSEGYTGFARDSSVMSFRANCFMLMNALSTLMPGFQGPLGMPIQSGFGLPGRGLLGPSRCFFGPMPLPRSTNTPSLRVNRTTTTPCLPKPTKAVPCGATVKPLSQGNSVSCGQTSVAMAVNSLTGKSLNDRDVNRKYGFSLLGALRSECRKAGYTWKDGGNFKPKDWSLLEKKLNREKTPVIMGLNGPNFSPSGRGHIVTLLSVDGNKVRYADPADGKIKTTTRQAIESAPGHPQGKFFFYANRVS
jgi:hypothetical protein